MRQALLTIFGFFYQGKALAATLSCQNTALLWKGILPIPVYFILTWIVIWHSRLNRDNKK